MNRSTRDRQMSITNAAARSAEMQRIQARLNDVDQELQRLNTAVAERNAEFTRAQSDFMRSIIREEVQRLEGQIAQRGAERQDILQRLSTMRQDLDNLTGRVGSVESRVTGLTGRVDGLQAHSEAHATAISRLEAANGWIPIIGGVIVTFVVYFIIEGVELLRDDRFTTQNQWFWAVLIGAIAGIVLTCLPGNGRSIITRSTASAGGNVVVMAPQPPADQPAPAVGVTPPPPPPSGTQFSTVHAAAAASASSGN